MRALYRKYRPCNLADVVGQPQVTEALSSALKQGRISHAYLFVGPRGTGKTSVARIFAHEVNGFKYEIEDDYVDIIEIDGASNRGIDNIRELREKAAVAPTTGQYKIYIIDEVHMLTKEAFNALLKTLEEPPAHVIFIMATTDAHRVPVTITSRAQTYTFRLADVAVMLPHLRAVCEKENIKIAEDALEVIVKRGGGSFRDSLSLLDQISTLSDGMNEITKDDVVRAMGLPEDEKITDLLKSYIDGDTKKIAVYLRELLSNGIKPETVTEEMINQIIENPKTELLPLLAKLPEVKAPFAEAKLLVALMSGSALPESRPNPPKTMSKTESPISARVSPPSQPDIANNTGGKNFSWNDFIEKIKNLNDAIYSQLLRVEYKLNGATLDIYPRNKTIYNILSRDVNRRILTDNANGVKVAIHGAEEKPVNVSKDTLLTKFSDIMGGEVKEDGGSDPF